MSIENALKDFVRSPEGGALVLQGPWGLGKTYFWKHRIVETFLADKTTPKTSKQYAYVSLFGVESLADLKASMFQISNEFDSEFLSSRWRFASPRWLWWKAKQFLPLAVDAAAIPYVREGLSRSYNALTFFAIRNRLICLDDIERRGDGLKLLDVLGLVSQLAEQRGCRVMVILNTGALNETDQPVWDAYKEKVFLGEMTYSPSISDCVDLGLDDAKEEGWTKTARERLLQLAVSNIRIVQRVKRSIRKAIAAAGATLRPETIDRIAEVVVLLEYSHSGKGDGAPPLDYVMRTGEFDYALHSLSKEEKSEDEERWSKMLSDYGMFIGEEIDIALAEMIQQGFPDPEKLAAAAEQFEQNVQAHADKDAWQQAWHIYHDNLDDNGEQFIAALVAAWPAVSVREHANNLQTLVQFLRENGKAEVASEFINAWIEQRSGDRIEELSPDEHHMFGPIEDEELTTAMQRAYATRREALSLPEALKAMGETDGIRQEAVAAIAGSNPEAIEAALVAGPGRYLSRAITNTLKLGVRADEPSWEAARDNMREALLLNAQRSKFNTDRNWHKFKVRQAEPEPEDN